MSVELFVAQKQRGASAQNFVNMQPNVSTHTAQVAYIRGYKHSDEHEYVVLCVAQGTQIGLGRAVLQSGSGFLATLSAVLGLDTSSATAHAVNGNKGLCTVLIVTTMVIIEHASTAVVLAECILGTSMNEMTWDEQVQPLCPSHACFVDLYNLLGTL